MATVRLFEQAAHASLYSKYRPTYPKSVVNAITSYVSNRGGTLSLALDVACGSGQSTFYLKDNFKQVIGVDVSKAQIEEANSKCRTQNADNVQFSLGNGLELPVESDSVDVVTIAQALHWLDASKFFTECQRVLKRNGCLAVYGYGNVRLVNEQCNTLVSSFYRDTLKGCWHDTRCHIDEEYRDIDLPFSNVHRIDTSMPYKTSLEAFIGYISSWSGYQKYCEDHPDNTVLEDMCASMKKILVDESNESNGCERGSPSGDSTSQSTQQVITVEACFPLFVLLGQKT